MATRTKTTKRTTTSTKKPTTTSMPRPTRGRAPATRAATAAADDLTRLSTAALRTRLADETGQRSRSADRRMLIQRITEGRAARAMTAAPAAPAAPAAVNATEAPVAPPAPPAPAGLTLEPPVADDTPEAAAATPAKRPRASYAGMSTDELRGRYLEVVGRPTNSVDRSYLTWKIREAQNGRVSVGPRKPRLSAASGKPHLVLPLRLDAAAVARMDEVWRTRQIASRMEFLRSAIGAYLLTLGAPDAAALFVAPAPSPTSGAASAHA